MSKQIKITPTDGLHAAIAAYAKEHNISLAKASAILVAQALNYTETPVNQHGGKRMKTYTKEQFLEDFVLTNEEIEYLSTIDQSNGKWIDERGQEYRFLRSLISDRRKRAGNWAPVEWSDTEKAESLREKYPDNADLPYICKE